MAKLESESARKYFAGNRIGHLHRGHSKVAATASIPSKYQTIVISNNEKKGFNSGSKRFDGEQIDDSPGPAKYCTAHSLLKENSASFSKKGLGGFVSKVKRFPIQMNQDFSVGPGQYNPNLKYSSQHDFNKAKCTSNFHKPIAVKCESMKFQTPAPNQYNLSDKFIGKVTQHNNLCAHAAFMSKTKRELVTANASNSAPAPGTYNICEKWTSANPRSAQAPFKSTTKRMLLPKSVMLNPGPGTYDPYQPQDGIGKRGLPRKHYLCISAPAMELPPELPSPGPGQYDLVNYEGPPKEYTSSSMFVSTTNRWSDLKPDSNPGPGTYNPVRYPKQSFMFNRNQKWI